MQNSSITYKTPKVGDGSPNYLEHWYYAIWAYNGFAQKNNPASLVPNDSTKTNYSTAYQTVVIGHANNTFKKPMIDLYLYNSSLFTAGVLPRNNIQEINGKHAGDFKNKDKNYKYIVTKNTDAKTRGIMDVNGNIIDTVGYTENEVVTIKGDPVIRGSYVNYYVEGNTKSGYVTGNWLKPIGDINCDGQIDIYDFVKLSKNINGQGTILNDTNRISIENSDVNMDGVVDILDIALTATNYNFSYN